MKSLRIKSLNVICATLLLLLVSHSSKAQSSEGLQWGESGDGLQLSIAEDGVIRAGVPNLWVTFRNLRDEEINLSLGIIGGWGPRPCKLDNREAICTFNFNLNVTDASGVTRKYKFRGMAYVAGRLVPYIVHLQAHSTYALELGIDQFRSPDTKDKRLQLGPSRYEISLEFGERAPEVANLDRLYIEKMDVWKGKLKSNTLAIEVAPTRSRTSHCTRPAPACLSSSLYDFFDVIRSRGAGG